MNQSEILTERTISIFQNIQKHIFGISFWLFYCLVLFLSVLQNGVWFSPQTERLLLISQNIFINPFINQTANEWLLSSFLGPLLGYLTSANKSLLSFSLLHLIIFITFFTSLIFVVKNKHGDFIARSVLIIFFLSPISNVLFTWLGSPDILTVLLSMVLVVFGEHTIPLIIGSFLLGINHPEQGIIILMLLTVFSFFAGKEKKGLVKFAVIGIGSLLSGKLLLGWYFTIYDFNIEFSRADYITNTGLFLYLKSTLSNPFALIFSFFNVLYIFIAAYIAYFWRTNKIAVGFLIYSLVAFTVILITLDQTRVFSILTFPGLLMLVLSPTFRDLPNAEIEYFKNVLTISFIFGILLPRFTVWTGNIYYSSYQNVIDFLHGYIARVFH